MLIAAAIKLDSQGPVFFRQARKGWSGRVFHIWKFRSMFVHQPQAGVVQQATRNDPRVTRVGAFLRRTSLDELPQLFNVLRGDMSFIGPRPETPATVARLNASLRGYELRHRVKPGLTGWSQAMGQWGARDEAHRLAYDLYYVRHRSVALDAQVLLRTLSVVLLGGAGR